MKYYQIAWESVCCVVAYRFFLLKALLFYECFTALTYVIALLCISPLRQIMKLPIQKLYGELKKLD